MSTTSVPDTAASLRHIPPQTRVFGRAFRLPRTPLRRKLLGWSFMAGGLFSFLPILGAWMIPVGFIILSVDNARIRRSRRRMSVTIARRWPRLNAMLMPSKS